jgi:hypothetical protein
MAHLVAAQRQIRSFMSDRLCNRAIGPLEIEALAKLKEAIALISEADYAIGRADLAEYQLQRQQLYVARDRL